jgi:hypothetical protein
MQMFGAPDPEADTPKCAQIRADTRASRSEALSPPDPSGRFPTENCRYEARYARYRNFQYLALSGEYLRICSCICHWL